MAKSRKTKKTQIPWLLIAGVLLLLGAGALTMRSYTTKQTSSYPPTPTANTAKADDIATWETYTDPVLGFQFKYPPEWYPSTRSNVVDLEHGQFFVSFLKEEGIFDASTPLVEWVRNHDSNFRPGSTNPIPTIPFKIDNYQGFIVPLEGGDDQHFFTNGKTVISAWYHPKRDLNKKVFDQVLTTFRFLDSDINGTYTVEKKPGLSFPTFTFHHPASWTVQASQDNVIYTTTISKNEYQIMFTQAPFGGSICLFDDTPMPDSPIYEDLRIISYTQLQTFGNILFRRYLTKNQDQNNTSFSFCQKETNSPYFTTPASIGRITYTIPKTYDTSILNEMDGIIKSLVVKQ
jgi:hypothetical protein